MAKHQILVQPRVSEATVCLKHGRLITTTILIARLALLCIRSQSRKVAHSLVQERRSLTTLKHLAAVGLRTQELRIYSLQRLFLQLLYPFGAQNDLKLTPICWLRLF